MNAYQKERIRILLQKVDDLQSAICPMSFVPNSYKDEEREFLLDSVRTLKRFETSHDSSVIPPNQDILIKEAMSRCLREFDDFINKQVLKKGRSAQIEYMKKHLIEISQRPVVDIIKDQLEVVQDIESHVYNELLAMLDEN
ncbi:MAG: hypothetical protein Q8933_20395 [Bacteroidota bacterium]|nr:hypothetical protein [Bacteroidota bacterium]MDP4192237.1 hypothetical protein [Bacteroidota bacterium]MDP4196779.1 hypothetical protein [Bacteroidota bacterium]